MSEEIEYGVYKLDEDDERPEGGVIFAENVEYNVAPPREPTVIVRIPLSLDDVLERLEVDENGVVETGEHMIHVIGERSDNDE